MSRLPFPSAEDGLVLHQRLGNRSDLIVSNDLCECYLEPLCHWLRARHPRVHPDECDTAADDALRAYIERPVMFDPARGELGAFLRMAAQRDLFNLNRVEARYRRHRDPKYRVEEEELAGNPLQQEPLGILVRREEQEAARRQVERVRAECGERERAVLDLMLEGERESIRFVAVLNMEQRPEEEQRREVKRVKDRLKKRIERKGQADESTGKDGGAGAA